MIAIVKEGLLVTLLGVVLGLGVNTARYDDRGLDLTSAPPQRGVCAIAAWVTPDVLHGSLEGGQKPLILDARDRAQYEDAHIVGALSVPFREGDVVPRWALERVSRAKRVVVYCDASGDCARSTKLAEALLESGAATAEIEVLEGGWPSWEEAHLPAAAGPCRECR